MRRILVNIFFLLFGCLFFGQSPAQKPGELIRFYSDWGIFLDAGQKHFQNKKVAEIYFIQLQDYSIHSPESPPYSDTIRYGIRKNGQLKYIAFPDIFYLNDSVFFHGYDTTHVGVNCKQWYYCDCKTPDPTDSIVCDHYGKIKFTREHYTLNKTNIFLPNGLLKEKRIRDNSPDGSSTFKIFYTYDKNKKLIRIDCARGNATSKTKFPVTDIFTDFEFSVVTKTVFTYTHEGLLATVTDYSLNKVKEFVPAAKRSYVYARGLLVRTDNYEYKNKEITFAENVGYKFY